MSLNGNIKLMNMSITVKELNDKHQLNASNNGVSAIDNCMLMVNGNLGIGNIMRIKPYDSDYLYKIDHQYGCCVVSESCSLLKADGSFGSIRERAIKPADQLVLIDAKGNKMLSAVKEVCPMSERTLTYNIRTNRGNYITESGLVVLSD